MCLKISLQRKIVHVPTEGYNSSDGNCKYNCTITLIA